MLLCTLVQVSHQSCPTLCNPMDCSMPFPCPHLSPIPRARSNSCPSSWWCYPTISSSVDPFSSCPQSFPASGSFPRSQFFTFRWTKYWSFSFSISPSNKYSGLTSFRIDWFDLLESKGPSRIFSNTTIQKHQFFSVQLSSQSKSHINTWPLEKTMALTRWTFVDKVMSAFQYAI